MSGEAQPVFSSACSFLSDGLPRRAALTGCPDSRSCCRPTVTLERCRGAALDPRRAASGSAEVRARAARRIRSSTSARRPPTRRARVPRSLSRRPHIAPLPLPQQAAEARTTEDSIDAKLLGHSAAGGRPAAKGEVISKHYDPTKGQCFLLSAHGLCVPATQYEPGPDGRPLWLLHPRPLRSASTQASASPSCRRERAI